MTNLPQNPDAIVVGAGTAGLSAAQSLIKAGLDILVLEADDHVGGRCITDTSTFATPFDRGGSWLHSAEINPLAKLAANEGFSLHKTPWEWEHVIIEGKTLSNAEVADYARYMDAMWEVVDEAGSSDTSATIDSILPDSRWKDTAKHFIAQMLGGDYDVTTPFDIANYADSDGDWLVGGGLGNFVRHLHSDVPVMINCPVSTIDHSGNKIRVTTPKGTIETNHVIITVSVGVLAAENIEFTPALPNNKLQAISDLPNGLLNKVGIEFDPAWKAIHEGYMLDYHAGGDEFCSILFRFYNSELATGFAAGRFAAELENEGSGALTDFCFEALRAAFGNDVTKYIKRTSETAWNTNPNTFGAYSYALPGAPNARNLLAEPIDNRIFFAGEATMPNHFATVHGAYISGKSVAEKIMNLRED